LASFAWFPQEKWEVSELSQYSIAQEHDILISTFYNHDFFILLNISQVFITTTIFVASFALF
jgi:hypothetical protein